MYHGDVSLFANVDFHFDTVNTVGAPTTLAGAPSLAAYLGNSASPITAGITLDVDFNGVGTHHVRVFVAPFNGYSAGVDVTIKIAQGSVGGTSVVGYVVGSFSIENRTQPLVDALLEEDPLAHIGPATLASMIIATNSLVNSIDVNVGVNGANLTDVGGMSAAMAAQVNALLDTALNGTIPDSIPADGVRPSIRQALYMLTQFMLERDVSGFQVTVKKPDGVTTLFTLTLNDQTQPTNITRTT